MKNFKTSNFKKTLEIGHRNRTTRPSKRVALIWSLVSGAWFLVLATAHAQYSIDWFKVSGGGGTSASGQFSLSGTIGQHDAGEPMTNGQYSVVGGFWVLPQAVQVLGAPTLVIVPGAPGSATISWAPNTPGFVLQEVSSLASTNWLNSPSGSANPVTVPAVAPAKFYRLLKP